MAAGYIDMVFSAPGGGPADRSRFSYFGRTADLEPDPGPGRAVPGVHADLFKHTEDILGDARTDR